MAFPIEPRAAVLTDVVVPVDNVLVLEHVLWENKSREYVYAPSLSRNPRGRTTPHARLAKQDYLLVRRRFLEAELVQEFFLGEE
jgi:hypothetical protein